MLYRTRRAVRPALSAASVKPRASCSGFSGPIHSPVGCWAILRICSASSSWPLFAYAATCLPALLSGLTQNGSASLGCWVIAAPALASSPSLSPSPEDEHAASSSAAPSTAAETRARVALLAPLLTYIQSPPGCTVASPNRDTPVAPPTRSREPCPRAVTGPKVGVSCAPYGGARRRRGVLSDAGRH